VRYFGEIPNSGAAVRKLVAKPAVKYDGLTFCYEAGPTKYGLYRLIKSLGHECMVVAPSLISKKSGERVKTNRRDAVSLAKLSRRRAHCGLGARRATRGHARSLAGPPGGEEGPPGQAPADCVVDDSVLGVFIQGRRRGGRLT
jgi:hypothetical protein